MTASHSVARSVIPLLIVVLVLLPRASFGQEPAAIPAFPTGAEAITADVVVLDKHGRPVRGLTREDFTFLVDGAPQRIVGFEARELATPPASPASTVGDERVATNEGGTKGRTFVFLVDDLVHEPAKNFVKRHLELQEAKKTIVRWLREKAQPDDELTLTTVSGAQWWSDRIDRGRADFLAVLNRMKIHDSREIRTGPAYRSESLRDGTGTGINRLGEATRAAMGRGNDQGSGGDASNPDLLSGLAEESPRTQGPGQGSAEGIGRRVGAILETTERLSNSLTGVRGRKSIVIFSDGIPNDPSSLPLFDGAVDASQRANTAVYFVDVKGLGAPELYRAEDRNGVTNGPDGRPEAAELGARSMYENYVATAGLEMVAENTGGATIRDTNDLLGGVDRIAEESSTYYLLGYQPDKAPDGKWHKLEVKVARPGVKIRMRRGYQALAQVSTPPAPATARKSAKDDNKKGLKRPMDPAVLTSGAADALSLRIAPYVIDTDKAGLARILVVLELDTSRLSLRSEGQRRTGAIDVTFVGMSRDLDKVFPLDERVLIDLDAKAAGGWMNLSRELRLPPGVAQVRVLVRDVASGLAGTVAARLEIPSLDRPYLATPILTDRVVATRTGARAVPVAHRLFPPKGYLLCSYEVVGMTNARGEATMKVAGGFTLRKADGQIVNQSDPTPIVVALGGKVRRILALPLAGLQAGEYELVLDVMDEATGRTLQSREAFVVGAGT